jgi:chromosome segregation ATPase
MSGWKLTAALLAKQLGAIGTRVAQGLAAFDPETATEVDRDNLKADLRELSLKLAEGRNKYNIEKKEADDLAAQIAQDEKAAAVLIGKFDEGKIDEATLTEFADNLEKMRARLPAEQQDVTDAKELVDTYQSMLDSAEQKLNAFEANAKKVLRDIEQAKADQERQQLRLRQQDEVRTLKAGLSSTATSMGALNAQAEKLRIQADATRIQADLGQKPLDRMNAVEEARRIAAGTNTPAAESAADRLRRLTGK